MHTDKLYEILAETTFEFRKGESVIEHQTGPFAVAEIYAMPHISEAGDELTMVDVEFEMIGVDKAKAEARRADLIEILDAWPDDLNQGPSYIAVGATMGSQSGAFMLFALGKVLGLWGIITPSSLGLQGEDARRAATAGYVMITGYHPAKEGV